MADNSPKEEDRFRNQLGGIAKMAIPLGLANLAVVGNAIVDSIMVGAIGSLELATVTLAMQTYLLLVVFGEGLALSFAPLFTEQMGSDDSKGKYRVLESNMIIILVFSAIAAVIQFNAADLFVLLGQDMDLVAYSSQYSHVIAFGILPAIVFVVLWEISSIYDKAHYVTAVSIAGFIVNILLNRILIFGAGPIPAYGISGAAVATVSVNLIMIFFLAFLIRKELFSILQERIFGASSIKSISKALTLGFPIGITELATVGFFTSSTILVGMISVEFLAAHAIAFQVTELAIVFVLGFGEAAAIKVGLVIGRIHNLKEIDQLVRNLILSTGVVSLVLMALMIVFSGAIPSFFLAANEVNDPIIQLATTLILIGATFTVLDALQIVFLGVLRGMHDTAVPMLNVVIGYWLVGVPLSYYLSQVQDFDAQGVWYGLTIGLVAVCLLLFYRMRRMRKIMALRVSSNNPEYNR